MVASAKVDKPKPPVYNQNELVRGWRILHEHVKLRVDLLRRAISGVAAFKFCALNDKCVSFDLNLRRCRVRSCTVNGRPAAFRLVSPLDDEELLRAVSSETARHRMADVAHGMTLRDDAAARQGELVVYLPASLTADIYEELEQAFEKTPAPPGTQEKPQVDLAHPPPVPLDQLPTLNLTVEYDVLDPTAGAVFYGNKDASAAVDPVYMLTDCRYGMARFWMPCLDTLGWCDRYLFDFDIAVDSELVVVASGDLVETRLFPRKESSHPQATDTIKVFKYRLHAPAHASEIVLAVGPFVVLPDSVLSDTVTHFCLPGCANELVHTCPPLFAKALAFCRDYFGSDPPASSFKHLFVGSTGNRADAAITGAGGIVVYSGDLLHTARCIDESFVAREAVMSGMVTSYFGRFLRPRATEDDWLIRGLAAHVTALGLQAILGRNWYRFRILDLMNELQKEVSFNLATVQTDRITDAELESVKRRSHIIVYMIEKRIGSDVMKRALRDIVAEGRSVTVALLKVLDRVMEKPVMACDDCVGVDYPEPTPKEPHALKDLNGRIPESVVVVSSGFDETIQGVSVAPFLKRLRAICGTDVRSLVRLWAASHGIPRMHIGYTYNPRKHCLDFAVKQIGLGATNFPGGKPLAFSGVMHVKVMEIEGVYEHSVEIRETHCVSELPCHSRRAKHKSAAQAEKEFNENPARASPVLWIRVDPENEWCKDVVFSQDEDAWTALLKGERDAVAQFEACRGLSAFRGEASAKALLALLEDEQLYWRVRAEAAHVLASCSGGLEVLTRYFRSCYMEGSGSGTALVRPNNFSNLSNYFVKRAIIRSISDVRVEGSRSEKSPEGAVPVKAAEFLSQLLSANDNTGNEFDDDHYVVELVQACGKIASLCIGDRSHAKTAEDGRSTTEAIARQLERYRSIEKLMPAQSSLVTTAVTQAICDIEVSKIALSNERDGHRLSRSILSGLFRPKELLMRSIQELSSRQNSEDTRLAAMACLAGAYASFLDYALWLLQRCDRDSLDRDVLEMSGQNSLSAEWGFIEAPSLRYKILDALGDAALSPVWQHVSSPLLLALRRPTPRARVFCVRVLRLIVGDPHHRVRSSALRLAKIAWGDGVPVCLMARVEYAEAKRRMPPSMPREIAPVKTTGKPVQLEVPELTSTLKVSKPPKAPKSSKNGKSSKSHRRKVQEPQGVGQSILVEPRDQDGGSPVDVDALDSTPERSKNASVPLASGDRRPPMSRPKAPLPTIRVPLSAPRQADGGSRSSKDAPNRVQSAQAGKDSHGALRSAPGPRKPVIPKSVPPSVPPTTAKGAARHAPKVPKSVAPSVPKSVPQPASDAKPKAVPRSVPRSVPQSVPAKIPRSVPKIPSSVPRSAPAVPQSKKFPFSWHPLDDEDFQYIRRAHEKMKAREDKKRKRGEELEQTAEREQKGATESAGGLPNGTDTERKKKKKKKKKRHHEGEDGAKKKKKRKKHKDEDRQLDPEPDFGDGSLGQGNGIQANGEVGSARGNAQPRKLGKLKIKLPPASSAGP